MGRQKPVPGPLSVMQPPVAAGAGGAAGGAAPAPAQRRFQQQVHPSRSSSRLQLQAQSQSQSQSHHSAKLVPTLGLPGETQRLPAEAAPSPSSSRPSISTSTSASTSTSRTTTLTTISTSTASPSISSVSSKSPRTPYTSKFSPRNLTQNSNTSPYNSPLLPAAPSPQFPSRPYPATQPPPSIPRKAVPQIQPREADLLLTGPRPKSSKGTNPPPPQLPHQGYGYSSGLQLNQQRSHQQQHPQTQPTPSATPTQPTHHRHQYPAPPTPRFHSRSQESLASFDSNKPPHISELHQRLPPISRAKTAANHQEAEQHHQAERRLKSSHGRRHDDKAASISSIPNSGTKQGFFFNFSNKATNKSYGRSPPPPPLNSAALHPQPAQSQLTRAAMNATDQAAITKQSSKQSDSAYAPNPSFPSKSETSLGDGDPNSTPASTKKPSKPKPFTLLSRTKSQREKHGRSPRHTPSPQDTTVPVPTPPSRSARVPIMELNPPDRAQLAQTPRTATLPHDPAYREAMSSSSRNHSADRAHSRDASSDRRGHQDRDHHSRSHQSTPRDGNGASSFFNNLRNQGGRVAETIGKGLFGKSGRSASTTERDPVDDEHYVLKVINLPLIEQTRLTRISKRLEESRDKTEFWMPAFPWRAIDYLNYKGCDVEGLYRVPGSGPQIKKWQRRFDEQHDVDLFSQEDLYDINIIGSMLKAWLRELPDELFPKEAQDRIARECAGSETVPQLLIDELSNLSPFNYYLLFAITCHLSLLLAHSDKNKMDFRNLCICFQPCMKIDAFCFKFLVCDWRDCWKGCRTEARYIEEEYKLFDQPPPPGLGIKKRLEARSEGQPARRASPAPERDDRERNLSSADSNGKKSQNSGDQSRLKKKSPSPQETVRENGTATAVPRTVHTELEIQGSDGRGPSPAEGDMRPLSPIKPLSPLGF